jgi:hypothetical protein
VTYGMVITPGRILAPMKPGRPQRLAAEHLHRRG